MLNYEKKNNDGKGNDTMMWNVMRQKLNPQFAFDVCRGCVVSFCVM